jgi:hypothetical protein
MKVWFGITANGGEVFDQKIRLNTSCEKMQWIENDGFSSSQMFMIKANAVPLRNLCIQDAILFVKSAGVCAIVATIQDKNFDNLSLVIFVPNSESRRCDIFVVPQQGIFLDKMNNYDMIHVIGAGENFSDNFQNKTVFLLTKIQFINLNLDLEVSPLWDMCLGLAAKVKLCLYLQVF